MFYIHDTYPHNTFLCCICWSTIQFPWANCNLSRDLNEVVFRVRVAPGPRPCRLWTASCPPPPPAPWPGGRPRWSPTSPSPGSWPRMWTVFRMTASASLMLRVTQCTPGPPPLCPWPDLTPAGSHPSCRPRPPADHSVPRASHRNGQSQLSAEIPQNKDTFDVSLLSLNIDIRFIHYIFGSVLAN